MKWIQYNKGNWKYPYSEKKNYHGVISEHL